MTKSEFKDKIKNLVKSNLLRHLLLKAQRQNPHPLKLQLKKLLKKLLPNG